jgi:hypothetical protein
MRTSLLAVMAGVLLGSTACASPRIVRNITGSGDQVKVIYERRAMFGAETGLIQCKRLPDGSLSECRRVPVTFNGKKGGAK